MDGVKMASTIKFSNFCSVTLAVLCASSLTTEARPAHALTRHSAFSKVPLAQTLSDIEGDNDVGDFEAGETTDNEGEEVDNELEIDADVEPVVDAETETDVETADGAAVAAGTDLGAPIPIGRNGWTGSGLKKAHGRNDHGNLVGESKASHVGIGFGVVILVIAVVVVSGLAFKRPGSNHEPSDLDLE